MANARLQRDRRERVQRDAEGAPGAAQNDHKRRVERARAQSAAEGLLLPAERNTGQVVAELKVVTSNKLCEPIL